MSLKYKTRLSSKLFCLTLIFVTLLSGCEKLVTVPDPVTQLVSNSVYSNDATAAAVLTGIYGKMSGDYDMASGYTGVSLLMGLASDELTGYTTDLTQSAFYTNRFAGGADFWNAPYQYIFVANAALDGVNNSTTISASLKQQLLGEAKFMRAFMYFYLVNLYGDVPLVLGTDYKVNAVVTRTAKETVYAQIVQDLIDAQQRLSDDYRAPDNKTTTERIRPNKGAATALLARVYLYMGKFPEAESEASLLINNAGKYNLVQDLNNVFLKNSNEAIWQLYPSTPGYNTQDGVHFVLTDAPDNYTNTVSISPSLISSFEAGDSRRSNWVGSITVDKKTTYYYPFKYKLYNYGDPVNEYVMVFRLAEQYLIRAEARAQQNNIAGAQADLNMIRNRAKLPNTSANTKSDLLSAVLQERRIELFTEMGNRWFDLKRSNLLDQVMSVITPLKGGVWTSDRKLLPIPLTELQRNFNLTQNPGYVGR
ncbi:RagB/SusD family nutrient uptake outer membrane protein [Pedobacter nutrimenti]|uniref:RagB/SusD family nutrient uptake outer membrane protein n=1 Tax=Pedobacter nutrimenti TaxID=1241337 RepID=UPI002930998B|nr:RagB/SusD family nutrient uptake outer membrane protein [Pedobacter nutrimenti]